MKGIFDIGPWKMDLGIYAEIILLNERLALRMIFSRSIF
jgi:hypothetical protein